MIARVARIQYAAAPAKWQFGISSLLWLMATIGMCLAFARPFGMPAVMLVLFAPMIAVLAGLAFARPGVRRQAVYWAVLCSALGAICVIPVRLDRLTFVFWPIVGAVAGAYCGARLSRVTFSFRTAAASVAIGWLIYTQLHVPFGMGDNEYAFDLAVVPIVCVGLSGLIHLIERLRVQYGTPREVWAAGLVFAVIAGNLAAAAINGGRFQ